MIQRVMTLLKLNHHQLQKFLGCRSPSTGLTYGPQINRRSVLVNRQSRQKLGFGASIYGHDLRSVDRSTDRKSGPQVNTQTFSKKLIFGENSRTRSTDLQYGPQVHPRSVDGFRRCHLCHQKLQSQPSFPIPFLTFSSKFQSIIPMCLQLFPTLQSMSKRSRNPPQHVSEHLEFIIPIQGELISKSSEVRSQEKEYRVSSRVRVSISS